MTTWGFGMRRMTEEVEMLITVTKINALNTQEKLMQNYRYAGNFNLISQRLKV